MWVENWVLKSHMNDNGVITCLNCGKKVQGNYCAYCGQRKAVKRFTLSALLTSLIDIFDIDKVGGKSLWLLMTRPGTAIRQYVRGKRKILTDPLKLFLLVGTIATFLTLRFNFFTEFTEPFLGISLPDWKQYYHYSSKYFTFFNFTAIPLFAFFSWLFFIKSGFNYIENLIMNCYVVIGQLILLMALTPLFYFFSKELAFNIYSLLNTLYNLWALIFFFRALKIFSILRVVLALVFPYVLIYFFNYAIYRIAPDVFWKFLDFIVG